MATEPIGIGMLGVMHAHASGKMHVLRESDEWHVVGACEPDGASRASAQQRPEFQGLAWMAQEELLAHADVSAIAVEGEVHQNMELAAAAIEAGKHIHLDKPPGEDAEAIVELLGQAQAKNLVVQMGYMFRYNPAFCFAFRAQDEGWLGDVFSVRGRMSTSLSADKRRGLERYPGGMMFELGCHLLDSVVRLLGAPTRVTSVLRHDGPFDDAVQDNTVAVFSFANAVATLEIAAMEVEPFPRRRFEAYGTKGSIVIEPLEPPSLSACFASPPESHPTGWHPVPVPDYRRYVDDFIELADCVRTGKPLSYSGEHDIAVQRALIEACGGGS